MIICMSEILVFTNRKLCTGDFLKRIEIIASCKPKGIVLREKDLSENEYTYLASDVLKICRKHNVTCILHNFVNSAISLSHRNIHLPMEILKTLSQNDIKNFSIMGSSCHSVKDAITAQGMGCNYITAGHIYDTDCKKGIAGRGTKFLKEICQSVNIPVFAIGGINQKNIMQIYKAGAKGACVMKAAMQCEDPMSFLEKLEVKK